MPTMYDAVAPANIPSGAQIVAGYVDGAYGPNDPWGSGWTAAAWARFPNARKVRIATMASTNDGDVLDVELGDATAAQAVQWVQMRRAAGHTWPTVYSSEWTWRNEVIPAFQAAGVLEPLYWVADTSAGPNIPPGAVAVQYEQSNSPTGVDVSVTIDSWPPVQAPPPNPVEETMVSPVVTFRPGQLDAFQVSAGTLWHKWGPTGGGPWSNECVPAACNGGEGIGAVTFPDQEPQVSTAAVPGGVCITVEDSTSRAWLFFQGTTGPWEVAELP